MSSATKVYATSSMCKATLKTLMQTMCFGYSRNMIHRPEFMMHRHYSHRLHKIKTP